MSDGKTRRYMNEREWQCFEDGVKYERERIIKLLQDNRLICVNDMDCYQSIDGGCDCKNLIALIKGEK